MQFNYIFKIFPNIVTGDSDGESMVKKTYIGSTLPGKM